MLIGIELRDAVNVIWSIPCEELHQLGSSLELDYVRMQDILSHYDVEEQHQRVMELWFSTDVEPTWEKLYASMSCRDSSTGTTSDSMFESMKLYASMPRRDSSTGTTSESMFESMKSKSISNVSVS